LFQSQCYDQWALFDMNLAYWYW